MVRKVVYLPNHSDVSGLRKIGGLTSVELQIDIRKLFFFDRVVSNDGMSPVVRDIFRFRTKGTSETLTVPTGFMGDLVRLLKKYDLPSYFSLWLNADLFPSYAFLKSFV